MALLPALAYGFATTFKMRELARCFTGAQIRLAKNQIVAEYAADRFVVGFDFGALVFVNVVTEERTRVLAAVLARVAQHEPHPPLEEDFLIEVREVAAPEVRFDRVIIPELGAPILDIITLLLAQSVVIDYYEEDLQEIIHQLDQRTDRMARTGRISGSSRELTRFVGSSISTRNQIVAALAVLDKPAATWESESLDKLYNQLRAMLEIDDRFKALEYKLRTIQDTLELLLDLNHGKRALLLEATVVLLIVAEIVIALVGHR